MTYYGKNGKCYTLGQQIGNGGEGEVFAIHGAPDLLAKIFKDDCFHADPANIQSRQNMKAKLETMLDQPIRDNCENGNLLVAWPVDMLSEANGRFVGYVMPQIEGKVPLFKTYRQQERNAFFNQKYTWKKSLIIARNLALALARLHDSGVVMGDLNPNNVLVDPNGYITLIDTASFNITNKKSGKTFKCCVSVPHMMPPELQGFDLSHESSRFSEKTDSFELGVLIFYLIVNNNHPFRCSVNPKTASVSVSRLEENIVRGNSVFLCGNPKKLPEDAPDMSIYPKEIMELFKRTFGYGQSDACKAETIGKRPTAMEWFKALDAMCSMPFSVCKANVNHVYLMQQTKKCPWCELEKKKVKPKPHNVPLPGKQNAALPASASGAAAAANRAPAAQGAAGYRMPPAPGLVATAQNPPRRTAGVFYLACIAAGVLFGVVMGQNFADMLRGAVSLRVSVRAGKIILAVIGAVIGLIYAFAQEEDYKHADNGWGTLLVGVAAVPVLTWIGVFLLSLLAGCLKALFNAVFELLGGALLLLGLLAGGGSGESES